MMAIYDYAKHLHRERIQTAERIRTVSALRAASRVRPAPVDLDEEWQLLWASSDVTGRTVTMVNAATGERRTGRHPADWDLALGEAARQLHVGV